MTATQDILRAEVVAQAGALAIQNVDLMKKPSSKKILKSGVTNLIGMPLLTAQSQFIGELD